MMYSVLRFSLITLAVLAACVPAAGDPVGEGETSSAVTARGSRVLAMDVGPGPGETAEAAVAKAKAAGVTTVVLNYDWNQLEPTAFAYQNAKLIADNAFYSTSPHAMSVVLNIRPIAGPCRVVPPDLATLGWSDPVMYTRFGYLLTWFLLFGGVRPVFELQTKRRRGQARDSDADQLGRLTAVPPVLWVLVFAVATVSCLIAGGLWLLEPVSA